MTTIGHETNPADARSRQIRLMQVILAGAATVAALALSNAARPGDADAVVASGSVHLLEQVSDPPAPATAPLAPQLPQAAPSAPGSDVIAVDDDTNPSSGDIFTQNAQDQSTA
jgi:hypothetical protein